MAAEWRASRQSERRELSKHCGLNVPVFGMGCSPIGELWDELHWKSAIGTVTAAYRDVGVRFFDTAPWYGNGCSEIRVGVGLNAAYSAREGPARHEDEYVVSTKVGRFLDPAPRTEQTGGPWKRGYNLRVRCKKTVLWRVSSRFQ